MAAVSRGWGAAPPTAWICRGAGLLLLAAAAAKGHAVLAAESMPVGVWLVPRSAAGWLVGAEAGLGLGFCLVRPAPSIRIAGMALFAAGAAVAAASWWTGGGSCGCLGRWTPPPLAMVALDLAIAAAFAWSRPRSGAWRGGRLPLVAALVLALAAGGWLALGAAPRPAESVPLRERLAALPQLRQGRWIVCCYRSSCTHCAADMPAWAARVEGDRADGVRWLFVDLDAPGPMDPLAGIVPPRCERLRMPDPATPVPLFCRHEGGAVVACAASLSGLATAGR